MPSAKKLRQQALELLQQAEAIDGKKPHLLVCVGGFDQPTTTVAWRKTEPTDKQAAAIMGFEKSDVGEGGYQMTVREISLHELMPVP